MEALQGKTVILVTHQVEFLPAVDSILVRELFHIAVVSHGQYKIIDSVYILLFKPWGHNIPTIV